MLRFIDQSYACRKGKGQHKGSLKCKKFVKRNQYCLKCDIKKFYPSINHNILFAIIQRKIKCKDTLDLLKKIIFSIAGETNDPIGNYTSQWFGNLYLNELDMFVKHKLKVKDYLRYSDDFILFSNNKKELHIFKKEIDTFLKNELRLSFSKSSIFPTAQGVDFLGYRHFKQYILLRKSTVKRVQKRIKLLPKKLLENKITKKQFVSSIQSTIGWFKWANSYHLKLKLNLKELLEVE